jgi:DNA/RNA-binding domain of Phe-tRNA-synthetase-like protein
MLLETTYKKGDTISIKLTSGEEMVANLVEENDTEIVLKKPMVIVAAQQGLALSPFMFSANPDAQVKLKQANVLCILKTVDELGKQYTQQTTGIVT